MGVYHPRLGCATKQPDSRKPWSAAGRRPQGPDTLHGTEHASDQKDLGAGAAAGADFLTPQFPRARGGGPGIRRWAFPSSLAATGGILVSFFSLRLVICLNPAGPLARPEVDVCVCVIGNEGHRPASPSPRLGGAGLAEWDGDPSDPSARATPSGLFPHLALPESRRCRRPLPRSADDHVPHDGTPQRPLAEDNRRSCAPMAAARLGRAGPLAAALSLAGWGKRGRPEKNNSAMPSNAACSW